MDTLRALDINGTVSYICPKRGRVDSSIEHYSFSVREEEYTGEPIIIFRIQCSCGEYHKVELNGGF